MFKERYGVKVGQRVCLITYAEDGTLRKKEEYTVEKLYPSVVLLRKDNGIKLCPGYPQLRWMTMNKKQRDATRKPVDDRRNSHLLPKDPVYKKLNQKQVSFCKWFVKTGDGYQSVKLAGYGSIEKKAVDRLLNNPNVQECIKKMREEANT